VWAGGALIRLLRAARPHRSLATLGMTFVLACAQTHLDRAEWQRMSTEQKTLYVRTLLGEQQAKAAKGGNARTFDRPAEEYARRIDEAYARGEQRDVDALFEEMGTTR
jgi:predicted Fe-S protein YdhL (DUF1289 family)